jgi:kynurenine formamidase
MCKKVLLSILLVLPLMISCSRPDTALSGEWVDLTHEFSSETIYWPTSESFKLDTVAEGVTEKGFYYSAYKFCAAEHGGTHIDAPIHFSKGQKPVDQIPINQLISQAVKIDVSEKALGNRDYQISLEDFNRWESKYGKIPDQAIVLLYTGYGKYWPDRVKYMGTAKLGTEGVAELHFPGLDPKAAGWLTQQRKINAVGLDTPSIDYGQSQNFESHQILAGQNIAIFENVANLDRLPETGSMIYAMPMKIKGGSGAPLRIIAQLPDKKR